MLEWSRDLLGINDSDNFGRARMFQFLTDPPAQAVPPDDFDPQVMSPEVLDLRRVLCIVGTNARDYEVAQGASRWAVGPQSDGLVQIDRAWITGAHLAYIHRSHSGRFGIVNSEEGYQNLRRFLFGDVMIEAVLKDFTLPFYDVSYELQNAFHIEIEIAVRSLPMLLHQQTLGHLCPVTLNRERFRRTDAAGGLRLFTNFLLDCKKPGETEIFSFHLALHQQDYQRGRPVIKGHVERLPLWSDYLIVEIKREPADSNLTYTARYNWASEDRNPTIDLSLLISEDKKHAVGDIPLPSKARSTSIFGAKARIHVDTQDWE